ncbi:similar to caspase-8 [Betaentomopoxvirus amoorei]|uniref:AMV245 n=1 Tax=Amsacta moorei entomopoxvirus TaxID=28321 RepID=Q9EMG1_AMEPV|nr:similar to caspase-8 [Amsacta moorei entomopoxvirus]AAG02951.1 AMV245 [Amsacta moorei entomopoxvirus]
MDISEYTNAIYDKLIELIIDYINNIKNELIEYIDKKFFFIQEKFEENNISKIKNYPDYIIGNDINIINTNITLFIPKRIDTRYKINNIIYIPYEEIIELSNLLKIYNNYYNVKIKNIYLEKIENIIILNDPLIYISLLKSLLPSNEYDILTHNINNLKI